MFLRSDVSGNLQKNKRSLWAGADIFFCVSLFVNEMIAFKIMMDTKAGTDTYDELRLENQFCFPLYACAKEVIRRYRKPLRELNLTYTQYLCMIVLWEHGGMTEGELGEKVHLESGTLAPLLKRLEKSGFIKRIRPENNERILYLSLTKEGEMLKERAKVIPSVMQRCIPLPEDDLIQLTALLNKAVAGMDERR